eukprot:2286765-Rhodomonas_salina.1
MDGSGFEVQVVSQRGIDHLLFSSTSQSFKNGHSSANHDARGSPGCPQLPISQPGQSNNLSVNLPAAVYIYAMCGIDMASRLEPGSHFASFRRTATILAGNRFPEDQSHSRHVRCPILKSGHHSAGRWATMC